MMYDESRFEELPFNTLYKMVVDGEISMSAAWMALVIGECSNFRDNSIFSDSDLAYAINQENKKVRELLKELEKADFLEIKIIPPDIRYLCLKWRKRPMKKQK